MRLRGGYKLFLKYNADGQAIKKKPKAGKQAPNKKGMTEFEARVYELTPDKSFPGNVRNQKIDYEKLYELVLANGGFVELESADDAVYSKWTVIVKEVTGIFQEQKELSSTRTPSR